jgi:hypothetical protein
MPSSDYFRRQADLCHWLATTNNDEKTIATLVAMANDFISKANEIDQSRGRTGKPRQSVARVDSISRQAGR